MLPVIKVFGYPVAMYGLCILTGLILGIFLAMGIGKKRKVPLEDILFAFLYGIVGVAVGGKLLYLLLEFPQLYHLLQATKSIETIMPYLAGGFVFYGGVLFGFGMVGIYCRKFKCPAGKIFAAIIPAVPMVHAIGRIGCFCAGCCYGVPYQGIGSVMFLNAIAGPNHTGLFPVQLVEMAFNFLLCLELTVLSLRGMSALKLFSLYLMEYSVLRFFLEFLRGDIVRGFWFGLSTSQWISLLLFIGGAVCLWKERYQKKKQIITMADES